KVIAKLSGTSGRNDPLIDAAIADLEPGVDWSARVNGIPVVGTLDLSPAAAAAPSFPAALQSALQAKTLVVKKRRMTTGFKKGLLTNIANTTLAPITRSDQISVTPVGSDSFSEAGDSGSALYVDNSTDNAANVVQAIFGAPPVNSPDKAMVIGLHWGG